MDFTYTVTDMKVYGYCRVSTTEQSTSFEAQRETILRYCEFKGLDTPEFISDEDVSGGLPILQRPNGSKLAGIKNANLIVTKIDRAFRSVVDGLTMKDVWNKSGVILHIVDAGGSTLNTESAIGEYMFTQFVAMAQFERRQIGERTSTALQHKKKTGKKYARAIFGFNIEGENLVENKEEQVWVTKIFAMKANKKTLQQIANRLNGAGVKPKSNGVSFYPSTIKAILENDIYGN